MERCGTAVRHRCPGHRRQCTRQVRGNAIIIKQASGSAKIDGPRTLGRRDRACLMSRLRNLSAVTGSVKPHPEQPVGGEEPRVARALPTHDGHVVSQSNEFELHRSAAAQPEREQGTDFG